jgi:16S rRNA (cytidine1402-2'-O)-methyltransferase
MSKIYVVGTPIGNLEDMTHRAIRILNEVDLILCEDTRVTKKLLDHYDIKTKTDSYHSQSKLSKTEKILDLLREGKDLALVSDAGTPTISDPGVQLISKIKEDLPDVEVIAIPGASALVSAISISGLSASEFTFYGFLPHKKGRETLFNEIAESKRMSVFYESPHRILKTLDSLIEKIPNRKVVIAREITKMFEEIIEGNPAEVKAVLENDTQKQKGEFVVIIEK